MKSKLINDIVNPAVSGFTRLQWVAAGLILGFFLGFVDTLLIAAILGALRIQLPAYFGIPTTFTGYFFAGMILGSYAPRSIEWEPAIGVLIVVELMMWGFMGLTGHGFLFIVYFILIPAAATAICYLGLWFARRKSN